MSLLDKLSKLFALDDATPENWNLQKYIWFRLCEYESEKQVFKSFDDYINYCLFKKEDQK